MIHRLDGAQVARLFPFHLVLDSELRIVGYGPSLAKIDPAVTERPWFGDLFRIRIPRIAPEFEALYNAASTVGDGDPSRRPETPGPKSTTTTESDDRIWEVEGALKTGALYVLDHLLSGFSFRMQMLASEPPPRLVFVGSPLLTTKEHLDRYGLTLSDFAPFDFALDYLLALRMKDSLIEETTQLASKLEQTNQDLQDQVEARRSADQSKDTFLMSMSHEIRTPMNAITGLTSLLLEMDPVTARRQHLSTIETAARTLQALIDGILEFSKLESGSFDRSEENFDAHDLVEQIVRLFGPIAREKGIELRHTIDDDVPHSVRGEAALFNRVLNNLTDNAIKFTEQGEIEIAVAARSSAPGRTLVRVEVTDTGIGITAADQARVFDRFMQVHDAASTGPRGSGLGLAISRKICEACGGKIGVESTPGQGSRFWFEFSLQTRPDAPRVSAAPAKSTRQTQLWDEFDAALPILVVDDNAINRNMVVDMIAWLGVETESAVDGEAAIACMANRDFGAILMDIRMPGMDGYETTRRIRERGGRDAEIPIIGLSANAFPEDREAGFAAGMNDYLAKPITMTTLVRILRHWPETGYGSGSGALRDGGREPKPAGQLSAEARELLASSPLMETGDDSSVIEYLHDFLSMVPDTLAALRQSLGQESFDEISRHAHNLKGSSLFLGLDRLTAMARRLELAAHQCDPSGVSTVLAQVKIEITKIAATLQTSTPPPPSDDLRGSR